MEIINLLNEITTKYFYLIFLIIFIIFIINISIDISAINQNTKKIKQLINNEPKDSIEKGTENILENLENLEK